MERTYICIDLKSYYASVECVSLGLNPMTTNLVVADKSRTDKTICLAVTPALKSYGVTGRPRLFEVLHKIRDINHDRKRNTTFGQFVGKSYDIEELNEDPNLEVDFLIVPPHMERYMKQSAAIYYILLTYFAPEDIHVYSIDESFIDITDYLTFYNETARQLVSKVVGKIYQLTGITATVGIGTNLYLAKIAMDILAKRMPADENGLRIAELDEKTYRYEMWDHRPIKDFWRIGKGYASKLEKIGLYTMGDIAHFSTTKVGEEILYKTFGVNAEFLIDHSWGYEPCTLADIKAYIPANRSISSGQVLHYAYTAKDAAIVVNEMAAGIALDLTEKKFVTNQITLTIGYDRESLMRKEIRENYSGKIVKDSYGREVPKHAHGTTTLTEPTNLIHFIVEAAMELYHNIVNPNLLVRRVTLEANNIIDEKVDKCKQLDLFTDDVSSEATNGKEKKLQEVVLTIQHKYGKNALLRGTNLLDYATMKERNEQIGGHKK